MKDLTKYYIDLSNCSQEQVKSLPVILEKAGETFGESIDFENMDCSFWTNFHKPDYATYWTCGTSNSTPDKTELTYPEFIKLFEGASEESQTYTKEDIENAYRAGENKQTYYFKDTTVILPTTYEGVDG